jgi:hypothetical protein
VAAVSLNVPKRDYTIIFNTLQLPEFFVLYSVDFYLFCFCFLTLKNSFSHKGLRLFMCQTKNRSDAGNTDLAVNVKFTYAKLKLYFVGTPAFTLS